MAVLHQNIIDLTIYSLNCYYFRISILIFHWLCLFKSSRLSKLASKKKELSEQNILLYFFLNMNIRKA